MVEWKSYHGSTSPGPLELAGANLPEKRSDRASRQRSWPDEKTHFDPLDTQTFVPTHMYVRTRTEGCLDQRAAVLFGRPTSDPFRAAHTGASCHAEPALLEFCGQRKIYYFKRHTQAYDQ